MSHKFLRSITVLTAILVSAGMVLSACAPASPAAQTAPAEPAKSENTVAPAAQSAPAQPAAPVKKDKYLIGMSQANKGEPWRQAMNDQIAAAAKAHPEFEVVFADAAQNNAKQVADVENFIQQGIDLLIISPNEAAPLTDVVAKAYDKGIPVIMLDRKVNGDKFTMWIGADNKLIGKKAGEFAAKWCKEKGFSPCNVLEIRGLEGATPAKERGDGFREGSASNPDVKIIASQNADWLREKAIPVSQSMFAANPEFNVVYAHNDPMAEAAIISAANAKIDLKDKMVIGIDALPTPDGGIRSVMEGRISETFVYPTGGAEAIDWAANILEAGAKPEKTIILGTTEINKDNASEVYKQFGGDTSATSAAAAPAASASTCPASPKKDKYLIGMSQANKGEPWRQAMNDQIASAAAAHKEFEVVFADAAQNNAKQVADVENFIQQGIDLLIISPNEAAPLTDVVAKAYDKCIPVILLDRKVNGDKYSMWIGADNKLIGTKAGEFTAKWCKEKGYSPCKVLEIRGLEGATPAKERGDGFRDGIASNPDVKIIASQNADWLREKAIPVSQSMFAANPEFDVVYAHNDPMAEAAIISAGNSKIDLKGKVIIGIDALPTPDGGIRSVMEGRISETFVYPTGGAEAIDWATKILEEGATPDRSVILQTIEVTKDNATDLYKKFGGK
jgi:ribose transport system substrate-binding protein